MILVLKLIIIIMIAVCNKNWNYSYILQRNIGIKNQIVQIHQTLVKSPHRLNIKIILLPFLDFHTINPMAHRNMQCVNGTV